MKKVNFVKFSVVHDNCWTALTENTDVRVQTVNESFQDKVYEAELVLWGRDVKKFMRELKENVLQLEVYGGQD